MSGPISLPTRVSRLYPVFTLIFLLSNAVFFYAWQSARLELESLPKIEQRNVDLEGQVKALQSTQTQNQATLDLFEEVGADADLLALLRQALGTREDIEIQWVRE